MSDTTCGKCNGTGQYHYTSIYGRGCFACKGTGIGKARKARAPKVQEVPTTIKIASLCGGDTTKLDAGNERALTYLGLSTDDLARYRGLWNEGVREVPNPKAAGVAA